MLGEPSGLEGEGCTPPKSNNAGDAAELRMSPAGQSRTVRSVAPPRYRCPSAADESTGDDDRVPSIEGLLPRFLGSGDHPSKTLDPAEGLGLITFRVASTTTSGSKNVKAPSPSPAAIAASTPPHNLHVLLLHRLVPPPHGSGEFQYHFPRAKPPNATSPTKVMISPSKKLHKIITTIPTITITPPVDIPAIPPPRRSGVATSFSFRVGRLPPSIHPSRPEGQPTTAWNRRGGTWRAPYLWNGTWDRPLRPSTGTTRMSWMRCVRGFTPGCGPPGRLLKTYVDALAGAQTPRS